MLKQTLVTSYYVALVGIITFQAVTTVYQLSSTIGFGQKVSMLENRKASLLSDKSKIDESLNQEISLYQISEKVDDQFQPIQSSIIVPVSSSVASR